MSRFFIAGCQRSGTTLMRLVLESHKDVECFDEARAYEILSCHISEPTTRGRIVGFKIPTWSEQLLEKELDWNELSPLHGEGTIANFYRGEPIIFMIRRPLDAIWSMIRLGDGHGSWLRSFVAPVVRKYCEKMYFREMLGYDIQIVSSAQEQDFALGALYWKIKSLAALKYLDAKLPILLVFYEELVASPDRILRGVLKHLSLDWDESVLSHHVRSHSEIVSGMAVGNTDPRRPIDSRSVGISAAHLSGAQAKVIEQIAGRLEKTLYCMSAAEGAIS